MARQNRTTPEKVQIFGANVAGVRKHVAAAVARQFRQQFSASGQNVTVKAVRFIPSSRTTLGNGSFQVVAANLIELIDGGGETVGRDALDSVVTVGRLDGKQRLEELSIPVLQTRLAHAAAVKSVADVVGG